MSLDALNAAIAKAAESQTAAKAASDDAAAKAQAAMDAAAAAKTAADAYTADRAAALQAFLEAFPEATVSAKVKGLMAAPGAGGIDPAVIALLFHLVETGAPYLVQLVKLLFHVP